MLNKLFVNVVAVCAECCRALGNVGKSVDFEIFAFCPHRAFMIRMILTVNICYFFKQLQPVALRHRDAVCLL
jgi:hypothetical protein